MKNYKTILAIDPSGNFEEGKGTTGICLFDAYNDKILACKNIAAKDYDTKEQYWNAHLEYINTINLNPNLKNVIIVIEDFTLDPKRALQQSHSKMETSKLIGILQLHCSQYNIPYCMQRATEVKNRWTDEILVFKHVIEMKGNCYIIPNTNTVLSRHCKDAIRHAKHYNMFRNKEI